METSLSNKIFVFKMAEDDRTTKKSYLVALSKDIYKIKRKLEESGESNWTRSDLDKEEADRIAEYYLENSKILYVG